MEDKQKLDRYWSVPFRELLQSLNTSENGLSQTQVADRITRYGTNEFKAHNKVNFFTSIIHKLSNPLVLILLFSSIVSAFLGEIPEFLIVVVILVVSVFIDSLQEHKANKAAQDLRQHVLVTTSVLRDGVQKEIPLSQVVPGDIVQLRTGDIIPADCRIIECQSLTVSQSVLTGESFPSQKDDQSQLPHDIPIEQRTNSLFLGTTVVSGTATALVILTGTHTEYGSIANDLEKKRPETDFEKGSRELGALISKLTIVLVVIAFIVNALFKHNIIEALLFSLAIAIGMTPELLPVIISINLSKGAQRMAKKSVIVKELPAIEIFGSMDVLCTDKTGTLTQDEIRLERYEDYKGIQNEFVLQLGVVHSAFQSGIQNPIEHAIAAHTEVSTNSYKKVFELPFDFSRKLSSVIVQTEDSLLMISKGAPETILSRTTKYLVGKKSYALTPIIRREILKKFKELSSDGFRVLAVTQKNIQAKKAYSTNDENDLTFAGFMSFFDPPKNGAAEALIALHKQGVSLKILTGDNEFVTQKICQELQLPIGNILTGKQIEKLSDSELIALVDTTTIFARLNPEQKEQIILALKRANHVVGYLGDGMNDAIALRAADVGISVDNAIDAAKESADIILMHKSLRVLHDGVIEGRKTYRNIMKYILMGTSSNLGNMVSVTSASLILPFLPMLPVQILLNDLLYDFSELVIPGDNVDVEIISRPERWNISFIRKFTVVFGPISSLFDFLTFTIALLILKVPVPLFQTMWFIESMISQVVIIFSIRTHRVPFFHSIPSPLLLASSINVVIIAILLPLTPLRSIFGFVQPKLSTYIAVLCIVAMYVITVEMVKKFFYKRYSLAISTS